jgi:DNA-binding CsgD family transcriptional regulator
MVGRGDQLGELVRAWSSMQARSSGSASSSASPSASPSGSSARSVAAGRTVVITGAAGIGKSLLVTAAIEAFRPVPAVVLSGTARVHSPAPYDWLAAVLCGRDTADLPVPADALAWLAQHPDAPRERYAPGALLRLAVRVVRTLIGSGPAVLVVEDLHALDPASLNLIGELAVAPDLPALVLVTSRPAETAVSPDIVARTLARLTGAPGAVRLHLGPLRTADVAGLLGRAYPTPVPPAVVELVCERTGGNPYWIGELLAAGGDLAPEVMAREPLPAYAAADLTAREVEVLSCLAAGMSNKQVARSLGISVRTVTVHVSNLLRKTGSASRTEAALWAVQHRLAHPGLPR